MTKEENTEENKKTSNNSIYFWYTMSVTYKDPFRLLVLSGLL